MKTIALIACLTATALFAKDFDLQTAIDNASSGDTITIPAGTYVQPVTIDKSIVLEGPDAVLKIESNQPAIRIDTSKTVTLKNFEIQHQAKTKPQRGEFPYAVYCAEGDLLIEGCIFQALGNPDESPCAVLATDESTLRIKNSQFTGFNFTVQFWNESEGSVEGCLIIKPGHCGITIGGGASATLNRNIVTGSRYHGIRCTGGEIVADSNLIIANRNRGFYIGNKSAIGTLSNNLIIDNATGINVFANSRLTIANNVILRSTYAGLSVADIATLNIENNIIANNERGVVGFSSEKGKDPSVRLRGENIAHGNKTQTERIKLPSELAGIDPEFKDPDSGLFASGTSMGLTDPNELQTLWSRWKKNSR